MLYNYGEIIGFNPDQITRALEYFKKSEEEFIQRMHGIELIHSGLQYVFDISHPNISFLINSYTFDKEKLSVNITDRLLLNARGFMLSADGNGGNIDIDDKTVIPISVVDQAIPYFDNLFLDKGIKSHTVMWTYDLDSPLIFSDYNAYSATDILPINVLAGVFFGKRNESFRSIKSIGSRAGKRNIITKKICEVFFNNLSNSDIYCNATTIIGSTFMANGDSLSVYNDVFLRSRTISFSSDFIFLPNSPVSIHYAETHFAKKNLSNITKLQLLESSINQRDAFELISRLNFEAEMDTLFDSDDNVIDDSFKVEVSGSRDASSFKSLMQICTSFLNSFYADKLRMFLSNYSNFGVLSEMLAFLQGSIDNLTSSFVKNDECEIPLSVKDKGCNIPCDNIYLNEPNLMVTKQKLKAILICSLKCDTMTYTENQLMARTSPLPTRTIPVPGGGVEEVPSN